MPAVPKATLSQLNSDSFPNNNLGEITPADLRDFNSTMIASLVDEIPYGTFTASVDNSISAINTFTASGYPSYTALNSFSASQLLINTGYNSFTQSANYSIGALNLQTASFNTWTSSINQIQSNGVVLGNSTRINLVGSTTFFSASLVQNVGGPIATLTFTSDDSKVNTSSFNPFSSSVNTFTQSANISITNINATTASLNTSVSNLNTYTASQNTFNASATASISQLLSFSSSLDATYATDAQLNASASTLQANIDTKLNTSSFNAYTASQVGTNIFTSSINSYTASNDIKWNTLGLLTGSYATTGSNTFIGNQRIVGSLTITGSAYGNVSASVITSQTTSIDLSVANYFTLTLSGSTNINVTNPQPGVTATLVINTSTNASASFSNNVKQPSGSAYVASPSGNIDIISFTAVNSTTVYAFPAQSFV